MDNITVTVPGLDRPLTFPAGTPENVIRDAITRAQQGQTQNAPRTDTGAPVGITAPQFGMPVDYDMRRFQEPARQLVSDIYRGTGAVLRGAMDIPTFGLDDEIIAGVRTAFGDRPFNDYLQEEQQYKEGLQNDLPWLYGVGQAGGLAATAPFMPMTSFGGTGTLARFGNAALTGAGYGAGYGYGAASGPLFSSERATGAAIGAGGGAVGGVLGNALFDATAAGGRAIAPLLQRLTGRTATQAASPAEVAAAQRVGGALSTDAGGVSQVPLLRQAGADIENLNNAGYPVILADAGDDMTRRLMRSATNTSAEAQQTVRTAVDDRYQTQSERLSDTLADILRPGSNVDAGATRLALEAQARRDNAAAYDRAYNSPNANSIWDPELQRLTQSPTMQEAMRAVNVTAGNDAALTGTQRVVNPFVDDGAGGLMLNPNVPYAQTGGPGQAVPNLAFWDHVQRNLNDTIRAATRSGNANLARQATELRNALLRKLDGLVPEFGAARRGAAGFFGAEDALDAGIAAVNSRLGNADFARGFNAMSPAEQDLFREGYVDEMIRRTTAQGDSRNAINQNFLASPQARERLRIVFGDTKAAQIENVIGLERVFNQTRGALSNSTTAQQLYDILAAGGVGGLVAGTNWDQGSGSVPGILAAALTLLGRRAYANFDTAVATQVGRLLATGERAAIERAATLLAQTPGGNAALRLLDSAVTRGAAMVGSGYANNTLNPQIPTYQPPMAVPTLQ